MIEKQNSIFDRVAFTTFTYAYLVCVICSALILYGNTIIYKNNNCNDTKNVSFQILNVLFGLLFIYIIFLYILKKVVRWFRYW